MKNKDLRCYFTMSDLGMHGITLRHLGPVVRGIGRILEMEAPENARGLMISINAEGGRLESYSLIYRDGEGNSLQNHSSERINPYHPVLKGIRGLKK